MCVKCNLPSRPAVQGKSLCVDCSKLARIAAIKAHRKLKKAVIEAYGGKCACCGESHSEFLSIDHINGGGAKHRKSLGILGGGTNFYKWLKKEGFPQGEYQLLCHNCNQALGAYGYCPHKGKSIAE